MNYWFVTATVLSVLSVAFLAWGYPYRNAGRIRRCPRCRYQLHAQARPPCSECGYAWISDAETLRRRPRRWQLVAGLLALLAVPVALWNAQDWTYYVPKPLMKWMIAVTTSRPPVTAGSHLPAPNPALHNSPHRWSRLVSGYQYVQVLEEFLDIIEQSSGSRQELEKLVPLVMEAHALYKHHALNGVWEDSWMEQEFLRSARARYPDIDARFELPFGQWAVSELQLHIGNPETNNANWVPPPLDVHLALSYSQDARIRDYALERVATLKSRQATEIIERLAKDEDADVAAKAQRALVRRRMPGWEKVP